MPSVDEDESSRPLVRVAYTELPSLVRKVDNIDVSPSGMIVVQTEDTLYLLLPAVGLSPPLEIDSALHSHHDKRQDIPLCRYPLSIHSCPPDISNGGSGREAYLISYGARFMDAKWAPIDIGPYQSPILAALTTQSQIVLYKAEVNQFRGPWRQYDCLTGGDDKHIVSMAWAAGNSHSAWLLAGTRNGEVMIWKVEGDSILSSSTFKVVEGEVTGLYWSQTGYLALVTSEQVHLVRADWSDDGIDLKSNTTQPEALEGSNISIARWFGNELIYCTPGEIHLYDAKKRTQGSAFLQDSGEEESCCLRPAVSIIPVNDHEWEVMLQDGYQYNVHREALYASSGTLEPSSCLPPPNEVVSAMQRTVEAARGLFSKHNDGTGLTYTCHDGNEIASWSYHREPKCQFGLSFTMGPPKSRDLFVATQLLDAAIKGDVMHTRTFIIYYIQSSKKAEIISLMFHLLQLQIGQRTSLQAALRLSSWLQSDVVKEGKEKERRNLHERIVELNLARALRSRLAFLSSLIAANGEKAARQSGNVRFCTLLCKAAYAVSQRLNDTDLSKLSHQVMVAIGKGRDRMDSNIIDVGEACKACGSGIVLHADSMILSKCQKGHIWKRCATSLAILDTSYNITCSICSHESTQPNQAECELQRQLLESITACDLCNGKVFL